MALSTAGELTLNLILVMDSDDLVQLEALSPDLCPVSFSCHCVFLLGTGEPTA